jgi:hypothetical protein
MAVFDGVDVGIIMKYFSLLVIILMTHMFDFLGVSEIFLELLC